MAARSLSVLERRIHEECMSKPNKMLSQKEVEALTNDRAAIMNALNFLLKAQMLTAMRDGKGEMVYKANTKNEMAMKKDLSQDEALVMSAVTASKNEGIWTKHLKTKTELHQTVLNRCLKSLEQKGYIKPIKSVKFPTRKMFMLSHLEPSVEVTGGPWYTDQEFDTVFIKALLTTCLRFITERTLPKTNPDARPLYPISHAPVYPSALHVHSFLKKSRVTETDLQPEHVEALLDVLVYDGLIEKLPAFGGVSWSAAVADSDDSDDDDLDGGGSSKRTKSKSKSKAKSKKESISKGRKRKRSRSDTEDEDDSEEEDRRSKKRRTKKKADSDGDNDSDDNLSSKKKRSKPRKGSDSDGDDSDDGRSSSKKKGKKAAKRKRNDSTEDDSSSESDRSRRSKGKKKRKHVNSSSESDSDEDEDDMPAPRKLAPTGGGSVYRAVYPETVEPLQGWSQAPCCGCTQFEFCSDSGPVNPRGCEYFAPSVFKPIEF